MTLNDISSVANLLAAIGVLITLIYLSRQVRQGNMLAKYQARQRMVEQAQEELYRWSDNPSLRESFVKKEPLTAREQEEAHYFLLAAMRQREWGVVPIRGRRHQERGLRGVPRGDRPASGNPAHARLVANSRSRRFQRRVRG
jgi:hypothetical protein